MQNEQSVTLVPAAAPPTAPVVRWGALLAGAFVAVGVWGLLHMLGVSSGLISVNPEKVSSLRGAGIGTTVWSLIAPILALFVGGLATGRLAGPLSRLTGAIYGAVTWSLATLTALTFFTASIGAIVGGALDVGTEVASAAATAGIREMGEMDAMGEIGGLEKAERELLVPVNQRLQAAGKPKITVDQLDNAVRDAWQTAMRQGHLDREDLATALANNTSLTQSDAAAVAADAEARMQARMSQLRGLRDAAQQQTLEVLEDTGKLLLGLFFSLLLALAAAIGGAMLAVGHEQKRHLGEPPRVAYTREAPAPAE